MKCVFLQTPGEAMEGLVERDKLGYESVAYPSTQDTGSLRDTRYEEFAFFLGPVPDWTDAPKAALCELPLPGFCWILPLRMMISSSSARAIPLLPLRRPYCAKPWKKNSCAIRKRTYCAHFWNWPPGRLSAHLPGTSAF